MSGPGNSGVVVQRLRLVSVAVDGEISGKIGCGLLVLAGELDMPVATGVFGADMPANSGRA